MLTVTSGFEVVDAQYALDLYEQPKHEAEVVTGDPDDRRHLLSVREVGIVQIQASRACSHCSSVQ
jgi:hypothetical protein